MMMNGYIHPEVFDSQKRASFGPENKKLTKNLSYLNDPDEI